MPDFSYFIIFPFELPLKKYRRALLSTSGSTLKRIVDGKSLCALKMLKNLDFVYCHYKLALGTSARGVFFYLFNHLVNSATIDGLKFFGQFTANNEL